MMELDNDIDLSLAQLCYMPDKTNVSDMMRFSGRQRSDFAWNYDLQVAQRVMPGISNPLILGNDATRQFSRFVFQVTVLLYCVGYIYVDESTICQESLQEHYSTLDYMSHCCIHVHDAT